ncbi:hypothetical protein DYZ89_01034 [Listeria monocytogenes]|uniref:Crp/Fnr family transcriptional regulator n=1 Tax=Listeria monocytogenes TaxID=1639 RepID=A0AB37NLF4_LISMN|nr:hypothetical protein LMntsn_2771 [Listeria monocytogenes]KAH0824197.1 hypothetical protein CFSAN002349_201535 [Listeria monocytogenes CFSAN002349]CCO65361.1 hypothetical protein BN389_27870 [Listeria monocytogenes serotype 4b str. LL195]KSZ42947.1 hypothetical protein AN945_672 [Listeria monocytogenes]KSZ45563.1 hypothetical protein AN919_454 [Listeria monocytogenes]
MVEHDSLRDALKDLYKLMEGINFIRYVSYPVFQTYKNYIEK